jgi:ubiquinone biosynthesis protein COQ9
MMMNRDEAASDPRLALLRAVLRHVPFDGWSPAALKAGAADLGLTVAQALLLVPGGMRELASLFHEEADRQMLEALARQDLAALKVRERIALAVRLRLEPWNAEREAVRRLLGFLAQPQEAPRAAKLLYRTVDAIWHGVGDRSTDYNFYTKRALLAGVVSSTALYWLEDKSEACADSWAFLDRRIADVMKIPQQFGRARKFVEKLPDPMRFLRRMKRGGAA